MKKPDPKQIEKLLRAYVTHLNKEHRRLDREIERNTRHAPPFGATRKYVEKCDREQTVIEKHMERLEKIVGKLVQGGGMP